MSVRVIVALILLGLLAVPPRLRGTNNTKHGARNEDLRAIPLCKVLASPELYKDKNVTVTGTYRVGYEASELYCLSCLAGDRVWVEFDSVDGGEKVSKAIGRLLHNKNGTVNGLFTGVFRFGSGYGHMGAYQIQFSVGSASNLKVVDRFGLPPSQLSEESRKKVCQ